MSLSEPKETSLKEQEILRLALPKGRMEDGVLRLLADAGIHVQLDPRGYRPTVSLCRTSCKLLKPQTIVEMLHAGSRDLGFAGADWVAELKADVVELLDIEIDPVRLVAAAPIELLDNGKLPRRPITVASEYVNLTTKWMQENEIEGTVLRSYGATEVLPPEDADAIVDNTATGSTLRANRLAIVDELLRSSTRLYAHRASLDCPSRRQRIEEVALLLRSVLDARSRVMLELNVTDGSLEAVIAVLPAMREPTMARLHGDAGYSVKAAVPRAGLTEVIPLLKSRGATDIVVYPLSQIVP